MTGRSAALVAAVLAVVLAATLALAACGGASTPSSSPAAASPSPPVAGVSATPPAGAPTLSADEKAWLADKGTLQVGAFNDYPPFGFVGADGQATGISVDFWKLMAYRLGAQVQFTPVLFSDQLQGLRDGRFDSLAGIFPLAERRKWFRFSLPYYMIDTRIYTDAAHTKATTLKRLKGLKVAVVKDDSGQQLADAHGLDTLVVAGYPQAVKAVARGKAQAAILDELVGDYYVNELGLKGRVKAVGEAVASSPMTMPVRKDDAMLLRILDKGVHMVSDSEFARIYGKYMDGGS